MLSIQHHRQTMKKNATDNARLRETNAKVAPGAAHTAGGRPTPILKAKMAVEAQAVRCRNDNDTQPKDIFFTK